LVLAKSYPTLILEPGEILFEAGEAQGELYILASGTLRVERDGIAIARISEAGALVGEMSVLLGTDHTATVTAVGPAEVRRIEDGLRWLENSPLAAIHVATLACQRLDATSAALVQLKRDGATHEPSLFDRLFGALSGSEARS
ncbi:MAG: Crp/Fnr family transcriptional regulator, partial [Devosia sp.]